MHEKHDIKGGGFMITTTNILYLVILEF